MIIEQGIDFIIELIKILWAIISGSIIYISIISIFFFGYMGYLWFKYEKIDREKEKNRKEYESKNK